MKYVLIFFLIPFLLLAQSKKDTIRVFYLGGQSNMQGYGYVKELPDSLNKKIENVFIYQGNPVGDNDKNGGVRKVGYTSAWQRNWICNGWNNQ